MAEAIEKAWAARREGRLDEAKALLAEAIDQARRESDAHRLAQALGRLAHVERDLLHNDAAEACLVEATTLARTTSDVLLFAHVLRHHGDLYLATDRAAAAEPLYREAVSLYRGASEARGLSVANAVRSLALQREAVGDNAEARQLWTEARELYGAAGIAAGVDECDDHVRALEGKA